MTVLLDENHSPVIQDRQYNDSAWVLDGFVNEAAPIRGLDGLTKPFQAPLVQNLACYGFERHFFSAALKVC
jgi:hypothetical protein